MLRWRVKEVAEAKGVSVKELAQRSGVSPSTIRRLYRKPFHYTKVMTWAKLAKALEVPRSAILEERPSYEEEEWKSALQEGASQLVGVQEAITPVAESLESARGEER
jgi:transcriptional regulator with XRE-family HTH domain